MYKLLCLLFALTSAYGQTDYSKRIEYIQNKYAVGHTKYPILIFDQDKLEDLYYKNNANESEEKRAEVIQQYVSTEIGLKLDLSEAGKLEVYTTILKNGAFAVPLNEGMFATDFKFCAVFPPSPNSNQKLETMRITGLTNEGAYEDLNFEGLIEKLSFEELQNFSLFHELGHCLDQKFMPKNYGGWVPSGHGIHQSESFAEVFALMLMEKEGFKGTGRTRALIRNLYTQYMGEYFIKNPSGGFGNPNYLLGGIIYWLTPALLGAEQFLNSNSDFAKGDISSFIKESTRITNEFSLNSRSFSAIAQAFSAGVGPVLSRYQEYALSSPDLFIDAYRDLIWFLDFSPFLVGEMSSGIVEVEEELTLEEIDDKYKCKILNMKANERFKLIQDLRDELQQPKLLTTSQMKRQEQLNSIYEVSDMNCLL